MLPTNFYDTTRYHYNPAPTHHYFAADLDTCLLKLDTIKESHKILAFELVPDHFDKPIDWDYLFKYLDSVQILNNEAPRMTTNMLHTDWTLAQSNNDKIDLLSNFNGHDLDYANNHLFKLIPTAAAKAENVKTLQGFRIHFIVQRVDLPPEYKMEATVYCPQEEVFENMQVMPINLNYNVQDIWVTVSCKKDLGIKTFLVDFKDDAATFTFDPISTRSCLFLKQDVPTRLYKLSFIPNDSLKLDYPDYSRRVGFNNDKPTSNGLVTINMSRKTNVFLTLGFERQPEPGFDYQVCIRGNVINTYRFRSCEAGFAFS